MNREMIIEKIQNVIAVAADIDIEDIQPESELVDDLELSSLEVFTIAGELEGVFHIRLRENDLRSVVTVEDLAAAVENKL